MRILGIERDNTACNFYRILSPLYKMDEQNLAEIFILKERDLGEDRAKDMAMWADIIVFQRPATEAWFNFIKLCRKIGKIVVSDYDDDPFNTSPLNPYYAFVGTEEVVWQWEDGTKEMLWSEEMISPTGNRIFNIEKNINHRDMFRLNFKKSDLVTCTTDILREEFLKINPNVSVLPNLISTDFFPTTHEFVKKEVRIGWQGGASHYEDLYMVKDAIMEVLEKEKKAKFVYFGDMRFQGLFKNCNQSQIEWHSWVSHATYPYKLALLNLDIGLCPLVDNQFNRNKSAIKHFEYSMMGISTIASNISPYSNVITDKKTGLLVPETKEAWVSSMRELINDKYKRLALSRSAKDNVIENHNLDTKAHLWVDAYEKVLKAGVTV